MCSYIQTVIYHDVYTIFCKPQLRLCKKFSFAESSLEDACRPSKAQNIAAVAVCLPLLDKSSMSHMQSHLVTWKTER